MLGYTSAIFSGVILTGTAIKLDIVLLLLFSLSSAAFGFIINDLSDMELDKSAGITRNPLSTGKLTRRNSIFSALVFLVFSLTTLTFFNLQNQLLGLFVLFLYLTYSTFIRAKAKPVLDIVYHGLCLAILACIGYTTYEPFNLICFMFVSIVFFLSSISQILQEVRDYYTDRRMIVNTVTLLGKRKSLVLCLIMFFISYLLFLFMVVNGAVSSKILILSPLTYLILAPIFRALMNEKYEQKMLIEINQRRLILNAILLLALILDKNGRYLLDFFVI